MNPTLDEGSRQRLRILVVDDEPSIREVLAMYFTEEGHTVGTACDGEEGLQAYLDGEWDVIITDRVMPHRTGDQLAHEIRALDPSIPIILVTGFADSPAAKKGEGLFDSIVRKPFTRSTLCAAISRAASKLALC
jgi:CheY-like chemotaxis protein